MAASDWAQPVTEETQGRALPPGPWLSTVGPKERLPGLFKDCGLL